MATFFLSHLWLHLAAMARLARAALVLAPAFVAFVGLPVTPRSPVRQARKGTSKVEVSVFSDLA